MMRIMAKKLSWGKIGELEKKTSDAVLLSNLRMTQTRVKGWGMRFYAHFGIFIQIIYSFVNYD